MTEKMIKRKQQIEKEIFQKLSDFEKEFNNLKSIEVNLDRTTFEYQGKLINTISGVNLKLSMK